jgi:hypothetical protein
MTWPSIPLREVLFCEVIAEDRIIVAIVKRQGLEFELVHLLQGDQAALATDEPTRKRIEGTLNLPSRVLHGDVAAFLGAQTVLAARNGHPYRLHHS